ncbi:hypothetical protein Tco_1091702 [Tanacetum coccineum]|uniref:Uncharacterized protein n=1 Tax=Tanacetum coccineum TaxID=301880 RepID=A0ABQ5I902_9ASTR
MATPMAEDTTSFEDDQFAFMSTEDIQRTSFLLDNEISILKEELQRTNLELDSFKEKIKLNKQFPYLVGNICCQYRRTVVILRVNTASYMVTTA